MIKAIIGLLIACSLACGLSACVRYERSTMSITHPNEAAGRQTAEEGLYYLHQGDTATAQEKFQLAEEQAPADPLTLNAVAFYYEKTGDTQKANNTYFYALLLDPKSGTLRNNYGAFLCRNGYSPESIAYFLKAANTPHYQSAANAYSNAKFCAERLGDTTEYAYYTKLLRKPFPTQVLQ